MIKIGARGDAHGVELLTTSAAAVPDDGDARLTRLFHEHIDFVWRTALRCGLSHAEADDCAQQVFLVASRKLSAIVLGDERKFLFGTAMNVARTMIRARFRKREDFTSPPDLVDRTPNPEESLENARALEAVQRIFESMPEDVRTAFVLFEVEGLTMVEVARITGVPQGTVASRIRRGRDIFRAATAALGGIDE